MELKKYRLRYSINFENKQTGYVLSDIENNYHGLCDAAVFISIIRPPDGSYSQFILSRDGETDKELTENDLFKVWSMLGMQLSNKNGLKGWKKVLVDCFKKDMHYIIKELSKK